MSGTDPAQVGTCVIVTVRDPLYAYAEGGS